MTAPPKTAAAVACTGYGSADEAAAAGWDDVSGSSGVYRSARWLRSLDADGIGAERRYWIARRDGVAVGAACTFVPRGEDHPAANARELVIGDLADETARLAESDEVTADEASAYRASIESLERCLPAAPQWRVVALPYAWQPGIWAGDRDTYGQLLHTVLAADDQGAATVAAVAGVPDDAHDLIACLRAGGFHRVAQRPTTVLDLREARTWDAYLAGLPGRRRTAVAHERKVFPPQARVTVTALPMLDGGTRSGVAAVLAAHDTAKGRAVTAAEVEQKLCDLSDIFADEVEALVCTVDDRVAGAVVSLADGAGVSVKMYGADAELLPREVFPYFNLCYYETIEAAGARGVDTAWFGPTTYAAKVRRGCRVQPLSVWLRADGGPGADPGTDGVADLRRVDAFRRRALTHAYGIADPATDPR